MFTQCLSAQKLIIKNFLPAVRFYYYPLARISVSNTVQQPSTRRRARSLKNRTKPSEDEAIKRGRNASNSVTHERTSNYLLRTGSAAIDRRADGKSRRCRLERY